MVEIAILIVRAHSKGDELPLLSGFVLADGHKREIANVESHLLDGEAGHQRLFLHDLAIRGCHEIKHLVVALSVCVFGLNCRDPPVLEVFLKENFNLGVALDFKERDDWGFRVGKLDVLNPPLFSKIIDRQDIGVRDKE